MKTKWCIVFINKSSLLMTVERHFSVMVNRAYQVKESEGWVTGDVRVKKIHERSFIMKENRDSLGFRKTCNWGSLV